MKDIILITGASSDLGIELIKKLDNENTVILAHCNNSKKKLSEVSANLTKAELKILSYDLSSETQISEMIAEIKSADQIPNKIAHFPAPKVELIRFKDADWAKYQNNINIQLMSIVLILKEFLPVMAKTQRGKIVFVLTSYTLNIPPKALSHYITAKYALMGLMKSLAAEYAEKKLNINAVSPSMIQTSFLQNIPEKIVEINSDTNPFRRNALVSDIIPTIIFLLSENADYITGANIPISGGSAF